MSSRTSDYLISDVIDNENSLPIINNDNLKVPNANFSTFQVSSNIFGEEKSKERMDDHEFPCVCDLNLPRKSLTNEERFEKAKDYLRKTGPRSPRKRSLSGKVAGRVVEESSSASDSGVKKERPLQKAKKSPKSTKSESKSPTDEDEKEEIPRYKRKDISKKPKLPVRMNRAAILRLEKGSVLCGKRMLKALRRGKKAKEEEERMKKGRIIGEDCLYQQCKIPFKNSKKKA
ncbi:hypothetical protein PGB90_000765 [Kerria lacca]